MPSLAIMCISSRTLYQLQKYQTVLQSSYPLSHPQHHGAFHIIRNHEYEEILPEDAEIMFQTVSYAGFNFQIPAICFGSMPE